MKRIKALIGASLGAVMSLAAGAAFASDKAAKPAGPVDPVVGWDHLWDEVLIDITIIGVVFGFAALYMMMKYRARSASDVGSGPKLTKTQAVAWALIPAAIFMADDFFLSAKGWTLWNIYRRVPENALEVKVVGYQWYWEFDYGDGVKVVGTADAKGDHLKVPVGRPVVLRMTAEDVIHSAFMPAYRVKEDVMPGRVTYLWFLPTKVGKEVLTCTEFCGANHSVMWTMVDAVPEAEFNTWLASQKKKAANETDASGHKV